MTPLPGFTFAFQPIVNVATGEIVSHEALVRGSQGEPAWSVLHQVGPPELPAFDERLRIEAIRLACALGSPCGLNLNLMPSCLALSPTAVSSTLDMVRDSGLSPEQITLEITENEIFHDLPKFSARMNEHRQSGVRIALDDFGAGYAGLSLLAEFQPDTIKLDMQLVRSIERLGPRQAIVRGIHRACTDLGIDIIAEGVETEAEFRWLFTEGIELFQGYLFARPALGRLPQAFFPPPP